MNKMEFISQLRKGLSGLPKNDIEERLSFYSEMIDDRIEEGLSEDDAILQIGPVNEIVAQIIGDIPLSKLVKERITPKKKLRIWEIILLTLGSPIWLSLLIAAFAVIISLYISLWSIIISFWAIFVSVIACALGSVASGIIIALSGKYLICLAMIGAGIIFTGLSIFFFYGCKLATKGILLLTKKIAYSIKNSFVRKEDAQ